MENSNAAHPNVAAAEALLAILSGELTDILRVIGSLEGPSRIAEILSHSVNATALASATRTLLSRECD